MLCTCSGTNCELVTHMVVVAKCPSEGHEPKKVLSPFPITHSCLF